MDRFIMKNQEIKIKYCQPRKAHHRIPNEAIELMARNDRPPEKRAFNIRQILGTLPLL